MIESIFMFAGMLAFVLFIIAILEESLVFSMLSTIIWGVLMAEALNIQLFYVVYGFNTTHIYNITTAFEQKPEFGVSALCLAFIFSNLGWAFLHVLSLRQTVE